MPATPEIPHLSETPQIVEHAEEFPETIQQSTGAQIVQKNFKSQITDDNGKQIVQAPPAQVITTVTVPSDQNSLTAQAKGNTGNASTWSAKFWLRVIKRALYYGWQVVTGSKEPSNS